MTGIPRDVRRRLAFHAETGRTWQTLAVGRYADMLIDMARQDPAWATPDMLNRIERALAEYSARSEADMREHLDRAKETV
jgi:hypothetical protein